MTVAKLATKAKVHERTIYNIISQTYTPNVSLARTIAKIFEVGIDDISEFEEE